MSPNYIKRILRQLAGLLCGENCEGMEGAYFDKEISSLAAHDAFCGFGREASRAKFTIPCSIALDDPKFFQAKLVGLSSTGEAGETFRMVVLVFFVPTEDTADPGGGGSIRRLKATTGFNHFSFTE